MSVGRACTRKHALVLALTLALPMIVSGPARIAANVMPSHPHESVTIAATRYVGACPVLVAAQNGYFERERVAVDVRFEPSGRVALDAVVQGRATLATVSETPVVFAAAGGKPVSIVATISAAALDHGVVARVASPDELRGQRIGVPLYTSVHFYLEAFLNRHGLATRDVILRDLTPDLAVVALGRGEIDAMAGWQPVLNAAVSALAGRGKLFADDGVYDVMYNLAARSDYAARNPHVLERVLRATVEGARFCESQPERGSELLQRLVEPHAWHFAQLWPAYRFRIALDQGLLLALEDETRWAMKRGLIAPAKFPNYLQNIAFGPLERVAPAMVTMIH